MKINAKISTKTYTNLKSNLQPLISDHNGITLVALIITIIVMLILVGVSVSIAIKGGLFDITKRAVKETEEAKNVEQQLSNGRVKIDNVWYDSIADYVEGRKSDNQTEPEKPVTPPEEPVNPPEEPDATIKTYDNTAKDANGVLTANATYTVDGKTAIVPKGFKIIEGIEGTKSINDGLVIQDKDGNEFVWIPVEVTESDTETNIASFYRSDWENNARTTGLDAKYTEPYASGYTTQEGKTEAEEYAEMVKSVYKNKGFYVGRYETGSTTQRTNKANGTTTMVVKKNQYPYNYVGWGSSMSDYTSNVLYEGMNQGKGAVYLSKNMYEGETVGVTSTLCYGIQWDAMLDFIKDNNHDVTNSSTWGNYELISGKGTLKNTGSKDIYSARNIYDIAGNLWEWTMETSSSNNRCNRGGGFFDRAPASIRDENEPNCSQSNLGFRVALYIK